MNVPTIPEATLQLLALCQQADYGDLKPQVDFSRIPRDLTNLVVLVGGGNGTEEFDTIGNLRRREDYQIDLFVGCVIPGDTAEQAMNRAWQMWGAVAVKLREATQNRPRGSTIQWYGTSVADWAWSAEPEGYGYSINGSVQFAATT